MNPTLNDVLAWDVGNWSAALKFWEEHGELCSDEPLDCLEVGANGGGLSVWLATLGHRVVCSDQRNTQRNAKEMVDRFGAQDQIRFQDIDATDIPYENSFDVILFRSVLGAVGYGNDRDRQQLAVESMHRALRPGGRLLFAENLAGSELHRRFRNAFVPWGKRWRYVTVDEMREFLRPFKSVKLDTTGLLGALGRSEPQRRILSRFDRAGLSKAVPPSWRYIVYGVATK